MEQHAKINATQLFWLIVLFELGTALIVALGMPAKQDAWIVVLIGMMVGLGGYLLYMGLFRLYPDVPLTTYAQKILGTPIGWVIGLFYVLFFVYDAARDLRDAGDLLLTFQFDRTPLLVVNGMMIVVMIYVISSGIEVLARIGIIFAMILVFLLIVVNVFIYSSDIVQFRNLLPVLGNGWEPVIKAAFPLAPCFPFGEAVVFTMLFPYLNHPKKATSTGIISLVLSGLVIMYTISLNIAVLGADIFARSNFPLLRVVSKINVANVIHNMDMIALILLVIGGFFKVAILFYAAVKIGRAHV